MLYEFARRTSNLPEWIDRTKTFNSQQVIDALQQASNYWFDGRKVQTWMRSKSYVITLLCGSGSSNVIGTLMDHTKTTALNMLDINSLTNKEDLWVLQSYKGIIQIRNDLRGTHPNLSHPDWRILYHHPEQANPIPFDFWAFDNQKYDDWEEDWKNQRRKEIELVIADCGN